MLSDPEPLWCQACPYAYSSPKISTCSEKGWSTCCRRTASRWSRPWRAAPSSSRACWSCAPTSPSWMYGLPPTLTDEGLQAALAARKKVPSLPILVLSTSSSSTPMTAGRQAGAIGYLLKDRVFNAEQFIDAVRRVAAGTAMDPEVIAKLLASNAAHEPLAVLTPREREVLEAMAEGRSNAAISQRLYLQRERRGQAHGQHLRQARPCPLRRRQPPGPGRSRLPQQPIEELFVGGGSAISVGHAERKGGSGENPG